MHADASSDLLWGELRSTLHALDYVSAWHILSTWPEETRPDAVDYVLDWCKRHEHVTKAQLVRYTPWFEDMLCEAMRLETQGGDDEALRHYQDLLSLKADCLPAAIAVHRLQGRSKELLAYCCEQPWEMVEAATESGCAGTHMREFWEEFLGNDILGTQFDNGYTILSDELARLGWEVLGEGLDWQCNVEILPFVAEIAFRSEGHRLQRPCAEFLVTWPHEDRYGYVSGAFPPPDTDPLLTDLFELEREHGGELIQYTSHLLPDDEHDGVQIMMPSLFLGCSAKRRDGRLHPLIFCPRQVVLGCLPVLLALGERTLDERVRAYLWVLVLDCGEFGQRLYHQVGASFGARADPSLY